LIWSSSNTKDTCPFFSSAPRPTRAKELGRESHCYSHTRMTFSHASLRRPSPRGGAQERGQKASSVTALQHARIPCSWRVTRDDSFILHQLHTDCCS
jgi:hypothetical protein